MTEKKYIFGPVPSRRLGFSLGVDLLETKTCTYECVYCQVGRTPNKTTDRASYVNKDIIIEQIKDAVSSGKQIDYITFSGTGEPTLNSDIGEIIRQIKQMTDIPIAVITNGSLLYREDVQRDLSQADFVIPSIDAASQSVYQVINRADERLNVDAVNKGIIEFSKKFKGKIWVEVLFVEGINDSEEEIERIGKIIKEVRADKVQINTVVRPPAEPNAKAVSPQKLEEIKEIFGKYNSDIEIIAPFKKETLSKREGDFEKEILDLIKRRPCSVAEMSESLGIHINHISKEVMTLESKKLIKRFDLDGKVFYTINEKE